MDHLLPNLDACATEPIRVPGAIQPYGALLVVGFADLDVLHRSANVAELVGLDLKPGDRLSVFPDLADVCDQTRRWLGGDDYVLLCVVRIGGRDVQLSAHRSEQGVVLEFESPPREEDVSLAALYPRLRDFLDRISRASDVSAIAEEAVREVRALTRFDRVLLYSFDDKGDGTVLAEDGNGVLPSYLGLRFPASDIPPQARDLYRLNRIRLIADCDYQPVPIEPAVSPLDGTLLDLSRAALRSVSPVHLEYMRNMGTATSMSISILIDGELWGLISGHSRAPMIVNAQLRTACDILGQIVSLQIGSKLQAISSAERLELKSVETRLLGKLTVAPSYQRGLAGHPQLWMRLANASGAAVVVQDNVLTAGETPPERAIRELAKWLFDEQHDLLATASLASMWGGGEAIAQTASGVLAVSISQIRPDYIIWFRPEVVRTIEWGGDPTKPALGESGRLHPRKSFDMWKQQVRLHALPWTSAEVDNAASFRASIQTLVLRLAEERAELTDRLEAANKELESFSYSISHDLRAPFRHIVGFAELLADKEKHLDAKSQHYVQTIKEAALAAGDLVDDLLHFSQLGRSQLATASVDMNKLVKEVLHTLEPETAGRNIVWKIDALPHGYGDASMLRQVLQNLLHNAIKYSKPRDPAIISVRGTEDDRMTNYTVADNGVGFEMAYVGKLFGVFQRLHRAEDFEGTGIGLALVKRIVERHGGWIGAKGEPGVGAEFTFALPRDPDKLKRKTTLG
ncbi:ATP-binding protein [Rhodopseudomonas sp. B29]|uniref:ATP-binding protein n=1 Tax=Rhodopseudomonas sp. B29 TaxID=95607 RepID=UPI0003B6E048|nr:ATP-binding protein [Rhodopseudomonas sp. B29]